MSWALWLCIVAAAGGVCQVERSWVMVSRANCAEHLAAMRIVAAPGALTVEQATSVEVRQLGGGTVVAACVLQPAPAAVKPPASAAR